MPEINEKYRERHKDERFMERYRDTKHIKKRITELRGKLNTFKDRIKTKLISKRKKKTLKVIKI